jgi:tetratricopeptide (TPR) repeat protein
MKSRIFFKIYGLASFLITVLYALPSVAAESPKERVDYWHKTYGELKPEKDPRAARAQEIFSRVLNAAGKRSGVVPRLLVIDHNSLIASAIPDGGIIISKKVLDICYINPQRGDDRLAFVLGHEIAHQLKDDFWEMKFFQAIELSKEKTPEQRKALEEVQAITGSPEKVEEILKKELQADEHAIVYASMAGYNTTAVVTEDDKVNFFEEWVTTLDPARIPGAHKDASHPSPKHRAEAVKARLRQVLENVELFDLGVLFYQTGEYERAIKVFNKFLILYPSREVYHNLASCHHQLALKNYQAWKGDEKVVRFKLSTAIDPATLAKKISLESRGGQDNRAANLFRENIKKAIELYQQAISMDPWYYLSYNNLGCAHILNDEAYLAVGMFQKALEIKPDFVEALNNLGVAFFYTKNLAEAKESLTKSNELDPTYNAPLFNLAKIAQEEKKGADAKKYGEAYLKLDPDSSWADSIRTALSLEKPKSGASSAKMKEQENLLGLQAGASKDKIPAAWREAGKVHLIHIEEEPFKEDMYPNGVMTLSQSDEILMIIAREGYSGKSVRGVCLGSSVKDVAELYGPPPVILNTAQGASWVYQSEKITFQIRDNKVVSWMLF